MACYQQSDGSIICTNEPRPRKQRIHSTRRLHDNDDRRSLEKINNNKDSKESSDEHEKRIEDL